MSTSGTPASDTRPPEFTTVRVCDFAAVPVRGAAGLGIALGELLNGSQGLTGYRHVLGYAGYYERLPLSWERKHVVVAADPLLPGASAAGHYVFEAHPDGARFRQLPGRPEEIPASLWSTGLIPVLADRRADMQAALAVLQGTPYSAADYFALAAHRFRLHPLDTALKEYVASSRHMICSQLWDWIYGHYGRIQLFGDGRWPGYVTPYDVAMMLLREKGMTSRAWRDCLRQCP